MIEYVVLKNFKCFDDLQIRVAPLTLITGRNGVGKSTVMQALLTIRQSYVARYLQDGLLALNGDLVNLISGDEVLYRQAQSDGFDLHTQAVWQEILCYILIYLLPYSVPLFGLY